MKPNYTAIISFLLIVFTIYWSITSLLPSKISNLNTPKTDFSTERALIHLKEITKKPHYVGTAEHTRVKNYLIHELKILGLDVETQNQIAINKKWRAAVNAQNIMARIKGTDANSKALVLLSHYDSAVHSSLGASDDGSGIVTILEGIRAFLETGKKTKNDIIILFVDAEEIGLLGASAFVNHHAWANDVGLVLNFEARGSGGPSYMLLETNGGNNQLINGFNNANPKFPVANSLMYSIYKMLPNDTDLTIFREDGNFNGFNFAFIDDHFDYHSAQDSFDNLDRNTLEQQGEYLVSMLNYFANANLNDLNSDSDNVYFNFPKLGLVSYPFSWIVFMFIFGALLFLAITFTGVQKMKLTTSAMFAGFKPFLGALFFSSIVTVLSWILIKLIHPQYNDILHGFTYNGHLYITAFIALTLGITLRFYLHYFKKYSAANLLVAPLFIWGVINLLLTIFLKGAAFFIFPVYFALATLAMLLFSKRSRNFKIIVSTLLALPSLIVFAPLIKMFPVGLGLKMLIISTFFTVLLFGLLVPIIKKIRNTKKLSYLFFGVAVLALLSASFKSSYSETRKQPTSLVYVVDADEKQAYFASYEATSNAYTKKYLGENPTKGSFNKIPANSKYNTAFKLYNKTTLLALEPPLIHKLMDSVVGNLRQIHLQITPQRNTNRIEFLSNNVVYFNTFRVNGESLENSVNTEFSKTILSYYFTEENENLDLLFSIPKETKLDLMLYDISYDLFTNSLLNIKPRTDNTTFPTPFVVNDATIIKMKIDL